MHEQDAIHHIAYTGKINADRSYNVQDFFYHQHPPWIFHSETHSPLKVYLFCVQISNLSKLPPGFEINSEMYFCSGFKCITKTTYFTACPQQVKHMCLVSHRVKTLLTLPDQFLYILWQSCDPLCIPSCWPASSNFLWLHKHVNTIRSDVFVHWISLYVTTLWRQARCYEMHSRKLLRADWHGSAW